MARGRRSRRTRRIKHRRTKRGGEIGDGSSDGSSDVEQLDPYASALGSSGGRRRKGRKSHRRSRRGGDGAASWVTSNFGSTVDQQFSNTFGNAGGGNAGNLIPTLAGAPAVGANNIAQGSLALNVGKQSGGKRNMSGGYWAQVLQQALVPFGLLGLQNSYGRRHHNKTHKRRH
jgi:hypothetical protein